ncbi:MAG: DUF3105 domain-containing protein [Vicinamibacterales bacterium]
MSRDRDKPRKGAATAVREQLQQEQRRKRVWRAIGAAVIVAVAGVWAYRMVTDRRFTSSITTAHYPAAQHVAGAITYRESPPLGGPHHVVWQNCGIYRVPLHNEHAVHALEHGAIWITYRPDLATMEIQRLQAAATDDYMLLSPYPGLPAPVVVSAWNNQLQLTGADDPRLARFIRDFKNNPVTTPEFGASCLGGTTATADMDSLNPRVGPMAR